MGLGGGTSTQSGPGLFKVFSSSIHFVDTHPAQSVVYTLSCHPSSVTMQPALHVQQTVQWPCGTGIGRPGVDVLASCGRWVLDALSALRYKIDATQRCHCHVYTACIAIPCRVVAMLAVGSSAANSSNLGTEAVRNTNRSPSLPTFASCTTSDAVYAPSVRCVGLVSVLQWCQVKARRVKPLLALGRPWSPQRANEGPTQRMGTGSPGTRCPRQGLAQFPSRRLERDNRGNIKLPVQECSRCIHCLFHFSPIHFVHVLRERAVIPPHDTHYDFSLVVLFAPVLFAAAHWTFLFFFSFFLFLFFPFFLLLSSR